MPAPLERHRRKAESARMNEWCKYLAPDDPAAQIIYQQLFKRGQRLGEIEPVVREKAFKHWILSREVVKIYLAKNGERPAWLWPKTPKITVQDGQIIAALNAKVEAGADYRTAVAAVAEQLTIGRDRVRLLYRQVDPALKPKRGRPRKK